jgi:hypothetical protein
MLRKLLQRVQDFFEERRLTRAKERHKRAADNLDAVVRELLKK